MGASSRELAAFAAGAAAAALCAALSRYAARRRRLRVDFDDLLDRRGTFAEKYDLPGSLFGAGADAIPMWIADSDLPVCPEILEALRRRLLHPCLGYTTQPAELWSAVAAWYRERREDLR